MQLSFKQSSTENSTFVHRVFEIACPCTLNDFITEMDYQLVTIVVSFFLSHQLTIKTKQKKEREHSNFINWINQLMKPDYVI